MSFAIEMWGFAPAPVACRAVGDLFDAEAGDRLTCVVNRFDVIPRMSRHNVKCFVREWILGAVVAEGEGDASEEEAAFASMTAIGDVLFLHPHEGLFRLQRPQSFLGHIFATGTMVRDHKISEYVRAIAGLAGAAGTLSPVDALQQLRAPGGSKILGLPSRARRRRWVLSRCWRCLCSGPAVVGSRVRWRWCRRRPPVGDAASLR